MESKIIKNGKKEKILKGASYAGAAGVGSLGTMAYTSLVGDEGEAEFAPEAPTEVVGGATGGASVQSKPRMESGNDTIVAELTDEQVSELKAELREEIKQELLHDEGFISDVKQEVVATIIDEPIIPPVDGPVQPPVDPEVEVLDYATVTAPDGTTADIATMKIDGTHVAMIDEGQDGIADIMVVDTNGNQEFDNYDYVEDISMQGVQMHPLCEAARLRDEQLLANAGNEQIVEGGSDYINNADISDFVA